MRNWLVLGGATALAACGGDTGPQTVGQVALPGGTATPTFVTPTESKTYEGIGGVQHYEYYTQSNANAQGGQLYAGDANTARNGGISITYNPRDAIFELTINRPSGNVTLNNGRWQDPAHRTAFGGVASPQGGVPNLSSAKNIQYLEFGSASGPLLSPATANYPSQSVYDVGATGYTSERTTLFYQKPGTTTKYVTYAGFVRNGVTAAQQTVPGTTETYLRETYVLDRAAFVYGERTANSAVPKTGTGTYTGDMIATLVFNPSIDTVSNAPTYFQWIDGSATATVDFAAGKVATSFTGTTTAPALDAYTSQRIDLPGGSTFTATGAATIDMVNKGGFVGTIDAAKFARPAGLGDFNVVIAGSSMDGTFFGPNGEEIGGGFRIVGGTPDERIDILGAFTGKK